MSDWNNHDGVDQNDENEDKTIKMKRIQIDFINENSELSFEQAINDYSTRLNDINYNIYIKDKNKKWRALIIEYLNE